MPKTSGTTPGPRPVEKMRLEPFGKPRVTLYLEISKETGEWVTGTELDKEGNKVDRIHVIDKQAIVKRTPVEMSRHYGIFEEVKPMSNPKLPKMLYPGQSAFQVHHLRQYFIRDSRWAEEVRQPAATRRSHTIFECLTCHDLMSTERKFSDRTAQQQRARITDWKKIHSHRKENPMSNPTSCTGCGKAISGAYEAGSYSCSDCGTGVEINPAKNPSSQELFNSIDYNSRVTIRSGGREKTGTAVMKGEPPRQALHWVLKIGNKGEGTVVIPQDDIVKVTKGRIPAGYKRANPTSNPLTAKQREGVERALDNHEKLKSSYFWTPGGNASSRRNDEKRYNFGVKVEHKGDVYTYNSNVRVSVKNFYYTGSFHKNDKKGDVRIFKKLLAAK